jgi:hypothetical protein
VPLPLILVGPVVGDDEITARRQLLDGGGNAPRPGRVE